MAREPAQSVTVELTSAQVEGVLRDAGASPWPPVGALLAPALAAEGGGAGAHRGVPAGDLARHGAARRGTRRAAGADARPPARVSQSLLRGLSLLRCFAAGQERGIVELALELGMSPSTAHRYAHTLLELGLLERHPRTRRYRLAAPAAQSAGPPAQPGAAPLTRPG